MNPFFFPNRIGFLPFDSEFTEEVIRNTIEGRFEMEDEFWQCVSDEAKDLVRRLLEIDPEKRISLPDAMNHPWLKVGKH
jgi:serine/threonine protein kinase